MRLLEPAVGSGVLVLAFMDVIRKVNPEYLNKLSVTIVDIDKLCVKMAVLQVMFNNLLHTRNLGELKAYHGNSLQSTKDLEMFYHVSTPIYDKLDQLEIKSKYEDTVAIVVDEVEVEEGKYPEKEIPKQALKKGQLDLFE